MGFVHSVCRNSGIKIDHPRTMPSYGTRDLPEPYWEGEGSFISAGAISSMLADVNKLLSYIAFKTAKIAWGIRPEKEGWYYWRPNKDFGLYFVFVREGLETGLVLGSKIRNEMALKEMGGIWGTME